MATSSASSRPTERAATHAAAAIKTSWRPAAGQPSSDTLFEYLKTHPDRKGGRGNAPFVIGDVGRSVDGARTFEESYRIPYIAHVPLEPRAAVAEWQDGQLTVWTGTQRPFGVRSELAEAFHIPEDRVRVIMPDMGSAYGGKHTGEAAIEAARLAKAASRPVKIVWTRAEEFSWGYFRPAGVIDVKSAVERRRSHRVVGVRQLEFRCRGHSDTLRRAQSADRVSPVTSPLRQGSYRALASTANHYAREMHMDSIARALGVDAVQFRRRHLEDDRIAAVLGAVADKIGWPKAPDGSAGAGHRLRNRKGGIRRDRGGGVQGR